MSNDKFVLYRASAGSGKTYTLVREFLTLCLSSENVIYNNILAVTFTNKAANEMKAKILNNLEGIIADDEDYLSMKNDLCKANNLTEEQLKQRAARLYDNIIHNYSDLNVSTIDSFVQQISRTFARELRLPSQYRVLLDDDEFLDELIQRIDKEIGNGEDLLTKTLVEYIKFNLKEESKWRLDTPIKEFVKNLLKENAYKKGESLELNMLDEKKCKEIEKYINDQIGIYKNEIDANIKNIERFNENNNIGEEAYYKVLPSLLNKIKNDINTAPKDICGKTVKSILNEEKSWYVGKKEPANVTGEDVVRYFENIVNSHKSLYLINIVKKNFYLYLLRGNLLSIINQHIDETNKVHISEFNKRISDVIADCSAPFIYERIGTKFQHFFIDEFQDTSILQWFNFLPLINNSLSEGKMNLLVGDAKQAIYRFRSGEVEQIIKLPEIHNKPTDPDDEAAPVFFDYEESFKSYFKEYELERNYRSRKNVVLFNNSFFNSSKGCLSESYEKVYSNSRPQQYKENQSYDGCVNVKIFDCDKDTKIGEYKDNVKNVILADIISLKENNANLKYNDIAILVRNNSDGSDIAEFLSKNGIPVISSDSILLKSSDEVMLVVMTLKYMMNEKNKVTKLNLSFFRDICNNNAEEITDLSGVLKYDIDENKIKEIRESALSLYDLCIKIINMYGFNIVENVFLQYFMNMVHDWQNAENNGINAFLEYWDKKSDSFFVKITGKINAVQIITIHKSKGLEYKIVMYPYVCTKVPERLHSNEMWLDFKHDLEIMKDIPYLDNFILPITSSLEGTDMEKYYHEEKEKASFDDFNIMYVAMTRAKDILFLYSKSKTDAKSSNFLVDYLNYNKESNKIDNELLNVDFKEVVYDDDIARNYKEYQFGEMEYVDNDREEVDINEVKLAENEQAPFTIDWSKKVKFKEDPTMLWAKDDTYDPQEWGNLVHEIFSKITTFDGAKSVLKFYENDGCIDAEKSRKLYDEFCDVVNNEEIKEAYSSEAVVRNEMEILMDDGRKMRPDRYAELDDKVILIDYKTGHDNVKYYEQLREYAYALQGMGVVKTIKPYLVYLGDKDNDGKVKVEEVFLDRLFY